MDFNVLRATISGNSTTSRRLNYFPFILQTNFNQSVRLKKPTLHEPSHALALLVLYNVYKQCTMFIGLNIKT